jgi:hypothetical protein
LNATESSYETGDRGANSKGTGMADIADLLVDAIDLHIHAGPSAQPREVDAAEMLREAVEAGYQAFVVKDHFFPTMTTAATVQKHLADGRIKVYGGLALNNSVGGFNLKAVDVAHTMGAKFVWMPTVSANNHIKTHNKGLRFPGAHGLQVKERPIDLLNERGELKAAAVAILEYLAGTDMIIATGHGTAREVDAVVRTAVRLGVEKVYVNHPQYMIGATLKDITDWAALGAYIELNAVVYVPGSRFETLRMEDAAAVIKTIGTDRAVIVSDYGQKGNGSPVAGLKRFVDLLVNEHGISKSDITTMVHTNPAKLLGMAA